MARLKIALCITDLDVGGAEQALVALATRLDRSRFVPAVYCLGPEPVPAGASCVPALRAAQIDIQCLGGRNVADFPRVMRKLVQCLRRQRPDLVQTFLFHANLVGRLAARMAGVRRVVCGIRVAERRARWHLWIDRLTCGLVDRYVCVSQAVARFSATVGRLPPERLSVIPNGVDLDRYPASPRTLTDLGIPPAANVVAFVGRLDHQKGVVWLAESARHWLDQVPNSYLLLVGRGPQEGQVRAVCQRTGVAERVRFAGFRSDVPGILAASDLLVLPSRWEGMPNVVLEGMASRLPVVAADVEGVRELLGPENDAQIVRYGDTSALVDKLVRILTQPALAAELGRSNRLRAEQMFSINRTVRAYEDLWSELVERLP